MGWKERTNFYRLSSCILRYTMPPPHIPKANIKYRYSYLNTGHFDSLIIESLIIIPLNCFKSLKAGQDSKSNWNYNALHGNLG